MKMLKSKGPKIVVNLWYSCNNIIPKAKEEPILVICLQSKI